MSSSDLLELLGCSGDDLDLVWYVQLLTDGSRHAFESLSDARTFAESVVGNGSAAHLPGSTNGLEESFLYGPGNGDTSVILRAWPRKMVLRLDIDIALSTGGGRL